MGINPERMNDEELRLKALELAVQCAAQSDIADGTHIVFRAETFLNFLEGVRPPKKPTSLIS
jgi:hypothetical protein